MKLTKGNENLGLPDYIKFGIEIEAENVDYNDVTKAVRKINWHTDKDPSLTDSGTECVSPVLFETGDKSVWEDIEKVCESIKKFPADKTREAYVDHTCGAHVHLDASILLKNPEIMKNFLRLWAESEEIVYKMCNDQNDPIRPGALNRSSTNIKDVIKTLTASPMPEGKKVRTLKDCIQIVKNIKANLVNSERKLNSIASGALLSRNGMASPIGKKIQKQLEDGKLKIGKPKSKIYRDILVKNKMTPERFEGLNLTNLGNKKKNTIEFRMSNGTIDSRVIKENVFLYSSLLKTAVDMTQKPEEMKEKLKSFYKRDVSEKEKVNSFLELIMEHPEDREIFIKRWESVKDAPVFYESTSSKLFGESFEKEDFKEASKKVNASSVKNMFEKIKSIFSKDKMKGNEIDYGKC